MCTNYRPTSRELLDDYLVLRHRILNSGKKLIPATKRRSFVLPRTMENEAILRNASPPPLGLFRPGRRMGRTTDQLTTRTETVFEKPTYRNAWRKRQFCIVPMDRFYEPNYETGKPIRWRIERQDHKPFGVAAIYDYWKNSKGERILSFSLLTVNADAHAIMGRFHPVNDEKRSIVVIEPESYDDWLNATTDEAITYFAPVPADSFATAPVPK
jgi:putative SOS response-associated peptidase YedK